MEHTLYFLPTDCDAMQVAEDKLLLRVSPARREKVAARRAAEERTNALLAAIAVRLCAVRTLDAENGDLHFAATADGKPYLADAPAFCFSFAHTRGAIALAVSPIAVGVDAEWVRNAPRGVAARFFAPAEQAYCAGSDDRFFEVWTRKEAFAKRAGLPLCTALAACDIAGSAAVETRTFHPDGYILTVASAAADAFCLRQLSQADLVRDALDSLAPLT